MREFGLGFDLRDEEWKNLTANSQLMYAQAVFLVVHKTSPLKKMLDSEL
jgi:hypothetical protein